MGAVNVLNRVLFGAGGREVASTAAGRGASRMGARVAGRWGAMVNTARAGGAFGVVEAMGRPVGNAALNGMMIGAAANTGQQVYGNVTSGRNAFAGIPGAAIRGAIGGGIVGGAYGIGNHFMGVTSIPKGISQIGRAGGARTRMAGRFMEGAYAAHQAEQQYSQVWGRMNGVGQFDREAAMMSRYSPSAAARATGSPTGTIRVGNPNSFTRNAGLSRPSVQNIGRRATR